MGQSTWPATFMFAIRIDLLKGPAAWRGYHAAANKFTRRIAASVGANIVGALHTCCPSAQYPNGQGSSAQKPEDRGATAHINRGRHLRAHITQNDRAQSHRTPAVPPHAPARQTEPKVGVAVCAGASGTERRRCVWDVQGGDMKEG